jgi:hypothetical protein
MHVAWVPVAWVPVAWVPVAWVPFELKKAVFEEVECSTAPQVFPSLDRPCGEQAKGWQL